MLVQPSKEGNLILYYLWKLAVAVS